MTETIEMFLFLLSIILFVVALRPATGVRENASAWEWLCAWYVFFFLFVPFLARTFAPSVREMPPPAFALGVAIFYFFVGGVMGYENGIAEGERRARL